MIFPVIETNRLILRQPIKDDAQDMLKYLSDQDVVKHMGLLPFQSIEDALGEIQWYDSILKDGSGIRWGITLKENNKMIGSCGFLNMAAEHSRAEIGYELSQDYWGKGIAGEALEAVVLYGFKHFHLERIQALIEPGNSPSQMLVEAKGFQREGLLRHYEYTNGNFDDLYMYSLLKSDLDDKIRGS
ncbi:GNAT family N-acetyltransferase [Bacillus sp. SG-1]|uniref:GNAT family N-acetyltransferase n=1 Tax=Bacillus sp. SG-1 TaxID=161544 RepID=UPI0001544DDC|nr:GNAT family protein [Bacillus sp. SG-1]EDL64502.1 ribosomal-protein-alanine N-acetyltransferase [Bacillus sp. SG-1]